LNFTGAGVTCSDIGGKTTCNITGGAAAELNDLTDVTITGLTSTDTIEIQPLFNAGTVSSTESMTLTSSDTAPLRRTVDLDQVPIYEDVRIRVDKVGAAGTVTDIDVICTLVVEF
jgi:hypothetical protein